MSTVAVDQVFAALSDVTRRHLLERLAAAGSASASSIAQELPISRQAIAKHLPEACILCGWSLGGMMATRLAGLYPLKIKALITLAANVSFVADMQWPDAMAPPTIAKGFDIEAMLDDIFAKWK